MDLKELVSDPRTSLRVQTGINRTKYAGTYGHLSNYVFWSAAADEQRQIWEHQRAAACLLAAYLNSDRTIARESIRNEAALVKMATGAGKSAVITLLCRCMPQIKRVLVVTPRIALTDQLHDYIRSHFWTTMGLAGANKTSTYTDDGAEAGATVEPAYIAQLLPSRINSILEHSHTQERIVLVGTLQALDQVRRTSTKPPSDDPAKNQEIHAAGKMMNLIQTFDLVVVDEGHYEPAISWSRAIREADLPTVLFSATPYRNDYKSFRVRGRFVFNQSVQEALSCNIIRKPSFSLLDISALPEGDAPPSVNDGSAVQSDADDTEDSKDGRDLTAAERADARMFVAGLVKNLKQLVPPAELVNWKVIVRAERLPKLVLLQELLKELSGEDALVIHHAVTSDEQDRLRYKTVKSAQSADNDSVRFWLHETKLLEGVDDPSFIAVAIYDNFGNARQLVQQIGRVLRSSDPSRTTEQQASVYALPRHHAVIERSWSRYLEFEEYCSKNTEHVVISEAALPDRLISGLPDLQYVEGQFRPRYMLEDELSAEDIQLPASAAVFDFKGAEFDKEFLLREVSEAILGNDRFQPMEINGLPANAVAVAYYGWRTSPWLTRQFFPEWTLGVCILVKVEDLVFAHDTGGIVFDSAKLEMTRLAQNDLARGIPKSSDDRRVRVIRMSAASLDMSERAIRAQATRTASFEETFTDLLDPGMFPTSAFGRVGLHGRYLGFTQARVRDTRPMLLPLSEYLTWAEEVAKDIATNPLPQNPVFGRYAKLVSAPNKDGGAPKNVLIDLGDSFEDYRSQDDVSLRILMQDVDNPDLCADVDEDGNFDVEIAGKSYKCNIEYREKTGRYRIASAGLDQYFQAMTQSGRRSAFTFSELLNRTQSFRVIPALVDVVYANGKFYMPQGLEQREDGSFPQMDNLVAVPILRDLQTEKGERIYPNDKVAWRARSQFGAIKAICELLPGEPVPDQYGQLGQDLAQFDLVICDDDGNEIGDFLAIDTQQRRVCIIHAKASDEVSLAAVSAVQVVGRQALSSLAFCSGISVTPRVTEERWGTEVNANGKKLDGLSRIFKNANNLDLPSARKAALDALRNKSWNKEIWIVASRLLNRSVFQDRLENNKDNLTMQTSMFLASLTTSCARANARLRIYCHESAPVEGVPEEPDLVAIDGI